MAIDSIYYPHRLDFNETPGVAGQVVRFDSVNNALNYEMIQRAGGADPYPCFIGAGSAEPELQFTTTSIRSILSVCNLAGEFISRDLTGDNAVLAYRAGKKFSSREALSADKHIKVRLEDAMLRWSQFSARESEDVTISCSIVIARNDAAGIATPYITVGKETITDPSLCEEIYSLGPVIYNGRPLKSIHSVSWQNNERMYSRKTANNPQDPCWQSIQDFRPVITCLTNDLREVLYSGDDDVIDGQQADVYGGQQMDVLEIYLRKRKRTGFYVPDATAEHIRVKCLGGWKAHTEIDGTEPAEGTLEFHVSQNVSASGVVSEDAMLSIGIDVGIPKTDGSAPVLDAIGVQTGSVNTFFSYVPQVNPSGGVPTSWTAVPAPPSGLTLNTVSGVISGQASGTPETVNVTLTAINGAGNSAQAFDIQIS